MTVGVTVGDGTVTPIFLCGSICYGGKVTGDSDFRIIGVRLSPRTAMIFSFVWWIQAVIK